jgi:EAL and modified HD-GYP domain-containing signal transduction protein
VNLEGARSAPQIRGQSDAMPAARLKLWRAPADDEGMTPTTTAPAAPLHEVAVVRQPILDVRRKVIGYELTFGEGSVHGAATGSGANPRATSALLLDVFGDLGLEKIVGAYPAWISVARDWLVEVGMPPLRPDRAVLQIAAYPGRDDVLETLQRLSRTGYALTLEDYDGRDDLGELMTLCGTVKVDVAGHDDHALREMIAGPVRHGSQLIATGVATDEDFGRCRALGFTGFQGEFLARPRLVRGRGVATSGIGALRTLGQLDASASFEDLDRIIASDVGLSLKLLRYVNSAFFALPRNITSVREALSMLGGRTVARWASVMALSTVPDAPHELIGVALRRARMCETLGSLSDPGESESYFTVGLMSVADALLDTPMSDVLPSLPFAEDVCEALLHRSGPKGELLAAVIAYENGEFPPLPAFHDRNGASLAVAYREALEWADAASRPAE